jgi:threonine/homoserine/homoserine lactone efflux protein
MNTELILALALAGATLGVVEGIKPGPLLTMVMRETLSGGFRAGLWTAAAPIFTDGPIVVVSLLAAGWLATNPVALLVISVAGALFLAKMGIDCFSLDPPSAEADSAAASSSFKRGVLTNLLNPHVYVFWFLIGGPLMAFAAEDEPLAPVAYALSFLLTIVITKAFIAYLLDRLSGNFTDRGYRTALAICGVLMLGFAIGYAYQAYTLVGQL